MPKNEFKVRPEEPIGAPGRKRSNFYAAAALLLKKNPGVWYVVSEHNIVVTAHNRSKIGRRDLGAGYEFTVRSVGEKGKRLYRVYARFVGNKK